MGGFMRIWLPIIVMLAGVPHSGAQNINILSGLYPLERVEQIVENRVLFDLYPNISDRDRWAAIHPDTRAYLIQRGEKALPFSYAGIPASQYLEDTRNGDYRGSADLQFEARRKLNDLVLAEAVEDQGRFLLAIVDLVWKICEESSWPTLSHFYLHKEGDAAKLSLALPDVSDPVIDLWAAETAKNLAWTYLILGEKFDEISPRINNRIKREVERRILDPAMERDDFWWMGFSGGNHGIINNWNPWISSNWLPSILLIEDQAEQAAAIHKLLRVVDQFINHYHEDGGIDEGPTYWNRAGGSLFEILAMLYDWSDGEIDVFDHPKIHNIIAYIYKAHISDFSVINFADSPPEFTPQVATLFYMGELLEDEKLKQFAASFIDAKMTRVSQEIEMLTQGGRDLDRMMFPLFYMTELEPDKSATAPYERDVWFEGVQQMIARSVAGSSDGFFLGAKGGHNGESHNHNDVGSFIIYLDGMPLIIDAGPQAYNLKTFGEYRYTLWNTQSGYHATPTINGVQQSAGSDYSASDVTYYSDEEHAVLSMNLEHAYAKEAGVQTWHRTLTLQRGEGVMLEDQFELRARSDETRLNFLTPHSVVQRAYGASLLLPDGQQVAMHFDHDLVDLKVEVKPLQDEVMRRNWHQDELYRIVLTLTQSSLAQKISVRFSL